MAFYRLFLFLSKNISKLEYEIKDELIKLLLFRSS